ncbi:uncharacterized protein C8R40DRAFT_1072884 [Lentinula edodes]|uniref:uncharacterized protein n=1 Tax=Lentinula edodes TaxID=5353 RepID=UPI001E8CE33F|nr:uncharacterized protein C8R40DRAFT_1072884 [Lentinula edodes]KAH7870878.1 hypothetical protein C8R40DRAFT_1072884 [Lentinula edodes]
MPLDGHSYLVAQGWSGKGNGLRKGAIAKPIAVSQKKTLAGLGKDRDEAFPFWDQYVWSNSTTLTLHFSDVKKSLFSAASQAITVKIDDSDVSDSDEITPSVAPVLRRTTTGILSNRRPVNVTPASTSGTSTPDSTSSDTPRLSLIAVAKREAAKRNLYSRFYRGAVLAPAVDIQTIADPAGSTSSVTLPSPGSLSSRAKSKAQANEEETYVGEKNEKQKKKKRKAEELEKEEGNVDKVESKAERRERKRRKKEAKEMKLEVKMAKQEASGVLLKESKKKKNKEDTKTSADAYDDFSSRVASTGSDKVLEKEEKAQKKKKKKKERRVHDTEQVKSRKEKNQA